MPAVKSVALVVAALVVSSPAFAQQAPPSVAEELDVTMQLLSERTGQVIKLGAELQRLGKQLQEARAELAKQKESKK
jgi:hypothetical protein